MNSFGYNVYKRVSLSPYTMVPAISNFMTDETLKWPIENPLSVGHDVENNYFQSGNVELLLRNKFHLAIFTILLPG